MSKHRRKTVKERMAEAEPIELEDWFGEIRVAAEDPEEEKGACLLKDPVTGRPYCTRTTKSACKKLKGHWVGGPCGR